MKRILFAFCMIIAMLLAGCSLSGVKDKVIEKDVLEQFQHEEQKVKNIEIIKSQKMEKHENVYVSFEVENEILKGKRYYMLSYDYYD